MVNKNINPDRKLRKCKRCGYVWITRKAGMPKVCGVCRSPYWNTPKRIKKPIDISARLADLKKSLK